MRNGKAIFWLIAASLLIFFITWGAIVFQNYRNGQEFWINAIAIAIAMPLFLAIVYFAAKSYIPRPLLLKSVLAISVFFIFCSVWQLITPSTKSVFDSKSGKMEFSYCPTCEAQGRNPWHSHDKKYCPFDGEKLVDNRDDLSARRGRHTHGIPLMRLIYPASRNDLLVPATSSATPLPIVLKKGQRLKVEASGEVSALMMGRYAPRSVECGPKGMGPATIAQNGNYLCGRNYMELCVHVGSNGWKRCGKECEIVAHEDNMHVHFAPNEAMSIGGKHRPELWENHGGAFEVSYKVL